MSSRRTFIKHASLLGFGYSAAGRLLRNVGYDPSKTITILYTNDTHARLEPFPENSRQFAGLGGIAKRASLIKKIRYEQEHVLLLDAGDVFQGTPWFDVYGGRVDFELMTEMGYDAMAIGNHEFDRGLDGFAEAAQKAGFPILAANYLARDTPMNPFLQDQIVKEFDGFRIGIFGLGIKLNGVVDPSLSGDVRSFDPVRTAERSVESLRSFYSCDYVICLSHLGYKQELGGIGDDLLAKTVAGINLIIGGHTHTFLDEPVAVKNPSGSTTWITQMGHSGVRLGRIDLPVSDLDMGFSENIDSQYYTIGAG
jgi:5'-nucleotidase